MAVAASTLVNRNVTIGGRRTSLRLEPAMWDALDEICHRERMTAHELCAMTGYAFDNARRLTQLITPAGQPIDLAYDLAGRTTGMTFPNTVTSTVSYDPLTGRLSQLTHAAGATPLADFGYGYNGVGNIAQIVEPTQTRDFTYDDLQRLTAGGTASAAESYAYDPEGNRTASHLSVGHVTDTANRLTEDDVFCYAYDANGNLTSKTAKVADACVGGVTTYSHNLQDQMIRIDFPDLTFAAYRYDGLGHRIEKDVNGTVTRYVYDGSAILLEYGGLESLLARYSHGQGIDQPLAVARDLDSSGSFEAGEQFYYQADHQGSVRKVTDASGLVVNSYDYDSYGNQESAVEGITNPFTYTGREFDAESGLYYYRARYYDAQVGRFISQDLLGFAAKDANFYRYVFNSPINLSDPLGLDVEICKAPADILLGLVDHHWIRTDTKEAGMGLGPEPGNQYDVPYITEVEITDHSGDGENRRGAQCRPADKNVDEEKVNELLDIGQSLGTFKPLSSDCTTFVRDVIMKSGGKDPGLSRF